MRPNLQFFADLVTFTVEILNGKLQFLSKIFSECNWTMPLLFSNITIDQIARKYASFSFIFLSKYNQDHLIILCI